MDLSIGLTQTLLRIVAAMLMSLILGWERESKRKPAGLRTHMMVALGSAAFTVLNLELYYGTFQDAKDVRADPLRIIEGIMGGLGFLGAGCIIQSRGSVEGITTAATIWVVGAIGVACGSGEFILAAMTTLGAFVILTSLRILERRFINHEDQGSPPSQSPA